VFELEFVITEAYPDTEYQIYQSWKHRNFANCNIGLNF
ncbi:uncharacterized protein METZ01_LOCUS62701, partial [marine metagenome]